MPVQTPITGPTKFEGGHADFLTRTDMLRRNPAAYRNMVSAHGQPTLFLEILDSLGMVGASQAFQGPYADFYFDEEDIRHFSVGSVITPQGAAGDPVTIALPAGEMKTLEGRLMSRPRKMEVVKDKNGFNWKIINKITTTNPHRVVLQPALATQAATFAANDRFFILAPRGAEATGQPTGLMSDYGMYTNRFGIYKETDLTSGTNMTTKQDFFNVPGLSGYAYQNGTKEAELRHDLNISKALMFDTIGDNIEDFSPDFDTNVVDYGTEGFLAGVESQGKIQTYATAAGYDFADFKRAEAWYRQKNLPGSDIAVIQGGSIASTVQDVLKDYMGKEINIKYLANKYLGQRYKSTERFNAEQLFIQLGFNGIQLGNYKFIFREASELNSLYGEGYTGGVDYSGYQFFVPLRVYKDAKNKNLTMNSMQMLHRGQDLGGYQRLVEMWETGGAGPVGKIKTDQWDVRRYYFRSEVCLMLVAGKWALLQKPGATDS